MTDVHSKAQRSYNMSRIKGKRTKPELLLLSHFKKKDYEYQPRIYGKPDFANFKTKEVVFVDGCFWHKCPRCFIKPSTNRKFWINKINRNFLRDSEVNSNYRNSGWKVTRIWEHAVNHTRYL